jgi:CRISPR-associated endonuclease/helicase Cas3
MTYDKLLAKSPRDGHEISLLAHTQHIIEAAQALFGTASHSIRLGQCWLRFFKLNDDVWPIFHANLLAACALHDWGKANDGFQDEVRGKRDSQAMRHEHFSALLIGLPQVTQWLQNNPNLDVALVLSAVMTHHLKAGFDPNKSDGFAARLRGRASVRLLNNHAEFVQLAVEIAGCLNLSELDAAGLPQTWRFDGKTKDIREIREQVKREVLCPLRRDCDAPDSPPSLSSTRKRLLLAVRAALIAADAAGSGLVREGKTIVQWIGEQFPETPRWNGNTVQAEIIDRRIAQINEDLKNRCKPPFTWNEFQLACDGLPARALLLAPCGSGKSLAGWRRISAEAGRNPVNRAIFLYPTRATAKEGFRDYVSWAPEADAALMHGTAAFDLQDMFDNESDPRHGRSYEAERRMFALGFWPKRAFSATVDQFLAFMQYGYGAVCMLPVLADSVLVIDEIHSFDQSMFSALKSFLQSFDVPVLCMTATLTQDRREQLERECGLTVYDDKPGQLSVIAGRPRYRLSIGESRQAVACRVAEALVAGRRVLWVVNTVARCREVLGVFVDAFDPNSEDSQLQTPAGVPIFCYHSRFRLVDRVARHQAIVENMRPTKPASLGITTQVCEMSLDLDVDLLVTEECPVTSLIQRMGRCNRDREARPLTESGEVIVYRPADPAPYSPGDLTGLPEFLALVQDKELSQTALEQALAAVPAPHWGGDKLSMFLESGPYALAGEETFRESEDYNRECVLFEDVRDYLQAGAEKKPGFLLPVPKRWAKARDHDAFPEHRRLPRHLGVAAAGHYHALLGYCDRPLDEWRAP